MLIFNKSGGKYKSDSAAAAGQNNPVIFGGVDLGAGWELTVYNKNDIAVIIPITDNKAVIPAEVVTGDTLYPTLIRGNEIIQCAAVAVIKEI